MQRISGYFLYQVGANLHPVTVLTDETTKSNARGTLYAAKTWLNAILGGAEMFRLRACWAKGDELRNLINETLERLDKTGKEAEEAASSSSPPGDATAAAVAAWNEPVGFLEAYFLRTAAKDFETQLAGELAVADLYAISKKRAFDSTALAEHGAELFPADLVTKVPGTVHDAAQAGRCLAFELNTACGFHLHRVNEAVLRKYFDVVTGGATPPKARTIGAYLEKFEKLKKGEPTVLEGLKSLKDLHRNPLMHPDHIIESTDAAMALHGAIQSVVVHMLKAIS